MKFESTTARNDRIRIFSSSNVQRRVWFEIYERFTETVVATELSIWDIDILITVLKKAMKSLQEEED